MRKNNRKRGYALPNIYARNRYVRSQKQTEEIFSRSRSGNAVVKEPQPIDFRKMGTYGGKGPTKKRKELASDTDL